MSDTIDHNPPMLDQGLILNIPNLSIAISIEKLNKSLKGIDVAFIRWKRYFYVILRAL